MALTVIPNHWPAGKENRVMRKIPAIILFAILTLCSGCIILSLHPIYAEQDIVFEPGLIGQWSEDGSKEVWAFSKVGTDSYALLHTDDKGRQGRFSAHLAKIGGKLFLDLFPDDPGPEENEWYTYHLLPLHSFLQVVQIEPILQMRCPDLDWLERYIATNPDAIRHEKIDDEIILTASTKELQSFWLKHLDTEGAFGDPSDMRRTASTITGKPPNTDAGDEK